MVSDRATACREARRCRRGQGVPRHRHTSAARLCLAIVVTCFAASAGQFYPPPNDIACPGDRQLEGLRPACSRAVPLRSNGPATGSVSMLIEGSMMGYGDRSVAVRVGYTACENSMWISMTSVACLMAAGGGQTRSMDGAVAVTVGNGQVSRPVTGYFSYDAASLSTVKRSNQRTYPAATLSIAGSNFLTTDASSKAAQATLSIVGSKFPTTDTSSKAAQGSTACEASDWISDTMLWCKHAQSTHSTQRVILTAGWRPGTVTEALSLDVPLVRGSLFDARTHFGSATYNPENLPDSACADRTAEVSFVEGYMYGCDGAWEGEGLVNASALCGAGFEICPSANRAAALGLTASACGALPLAGAFYATGESAALGEACASDGVDGRGAGASGLWGCGRDGGRAVWGASACGNLTRYLADEGAVLVGAWDIEGMAG
ncbi:hypothetical protein T484DRAFT_1779488, partial [Baffinella frigidus]